MEKVINQYIIDPRKGELIRLKKGMTKQEVISVLGSPIREELCKNKSNTKLIFKVSTHTFTSVSYVALFTREQLVYIAKSN